MRRTGVVIGQLAILLTATIIALAGCGAIAPSTPTAGPPTAVPPTDVPPTDVPPTDVPPTAVPPTDVPPTDVPPTAVPPTDVPPTAAPLTGVPSTTVPSTTVLFDNLPPPKLCPSDSPNLTPVSSIVPNPDPHTNAALGPGVSSVDIRYTNQNNQNFLLTISGRDNATIRAFALQLQLCFEAVPIGVGGTSPLAVDVAEREKPEQDLPFRETVPFSRTILFDLPGDNFLVEMEWLDARNQSDQRGDVAIYYAVDPTAGRYQWVGYKAACQTSAWASIRVSDRSATLRIWRFDPYHFLNEKTADKAIPSSNPTPWIGGSTYPSQASYDVAVQGGPDGGTYTIDGGWTEGTGGGC